jgi:hypothetical protein
MSSEPQEYETCIKLQSYTTSCYVCMHVIGMGNLGRIRDNAENNILIPLNIVILTVLTDLMVLTTEWMKHSFP